MKNIAVDHLKWLRCLIDNLEPGNRSSAIAFIAAFPDLWGPLDAPTKTALQATADNAVADGFADYRLLAGVNLPELRNSLLDLISKLAVEQLSEPDWENESIYEHQALDVKLEGSHPKIEIAEPLSRSKPADI